MTYDAEGRMATVSNTNTPNVPQTTLTYTYNTRDDRTALADNRSGSVAYSYDNAHRLTQARMTVTGQSVSPKVVLGYDNANRLTSLNRTNANAYSGGATVATALTFDAASRPTAISHTASGNTLGSYALTWDAGNQISSEVSGDGTVNYTYDNAGQLTAASGWRSESYSYDATGNRTMTGYSTGTGNRLASDGTFNYAYDYDGNMVTKTEISTGKVSEYVWDYRNRLTNVRQRNSSGGAVVQEQIYRYDPMDRRIGVGGDPDGAGSQPATWQWTVYDGQNPYADFDNSGSLTNRFLSGDAVDQLLARFGAGGTAAWYLTDQLGSVRDIANTSGSVIDHIKYDSFGKLITESSPSNGDRFKYTGREYDATTKQYNYRARYYDAAIGRFTSEDPIGLKGGDTNVYRYTGNSPTFMIDPTGLADTPVSGGGYGVPGGKIGPPSPYIPTLPPLSVYPGISDEEAMVIGILPPPQPPLPFFDPTTGQPIHSGPGAIPIPSNSVQFITDKTVMFDWWNTWFNARPGTKVISDVSTWEMIGKELARYPAGSLEMITLGGHGLWGYKEVGIQTEQPPGGGPNGLTNTNIPPWVVDVMKSRLTDSGVFVLMGCQSGNSHGGMDAWANKLDHTVVGNTGSTSWGVCGSGNWVEYNPTWWECQYYLLNSYGIYDCGISVLTGP